MTTIISTPLLERNSSNNLYNRGMTKTEFILEKMHKEHVDFSTAYFMWLDLQSQVFAGICRKIK